MLVDSFDYTLPRDRIAQTPSADPEAARLLVMGQGEALLHARIANLADHIPPGSLVVANDTKVLRARIRAKKEGSLGNVEIFLLRPVPTDARSAPKTPVWQALSRASKPLRAGSRVKKGPLEIEFLEKGAEGSVLVRLTSPVPIAEAIEQAGEMPLPPYIRREADPVDDARYQTMFARVEGAVAAPTAGLHLTPRLTGLLGERRCEVATCTLHVGLGTFAPVKVADLNEHPMHAEWFDVSPELAASIARARARGAKVVAIGTTVVRALESARSGHSGLVDARCGETRLLIQPGYAFGVVDALFTNFHLPRSTLLALVCAFGGTQRVLSAYRAAIDDNYRFFSYGDAMLLHRDSKGPVT